MGFLEGFAKAVLAEVKPDGMVPVEGVGNDHSPSCDGIITEAFGLPLRTGDVE